MEVDKNKGFGVGHKQKEILAPLLASCVTWEVSKPLLACFLAGQNEENTPPTSWVVLRLK